MNGSLQKKLYTFQEVSLPQLLDELNRQGIAIYYGSVTPKAIVPGSSVPGAKALLIGPEGGFSDREIAMIEEKGGIGINFAPHVLRLETAAIAGLTLLRFISLLVLCVAGFALTGCGQGDISKNPLMVKAEKLREAGDTAASRRYYRQAVARYPENPEVYFALGRLCDEELDDPYEALYCYRSFLQLAPQDDERRADVEKLLTRLEQRIVGRTVAASEAFIALQKENQKLAVQNKNLRKQLHDSKMYIIRRERQLQKNVSGRNGK
jgi:tetratricopeptide (TPR) repeat protein